MTLLQPAGQGSLVPPLRLRMYEARTRLKGATRPLLVKTVDATGVERAVVLKVRVPIGASGHCGPTSLACELICSVLARANGLPVPDYAIVDVPRALPPVPDPDVRVLLERNEGLNFGTVYKPGYDKWDPKDRPPRAGDLLDALEDVMTFDATILNGDRKGEPGNLLCAGDDLLLIDHSLAANPKLWQDGPLYFGEFEVRLHCTSAALRDRGMRYIRLLDTWRTVVSSAILAELRAMVPQSWETSAGELDAIFTFLHNRNMVFQTISAQLRSALK